MAKKTQQKNANTINSLDIKKLRRVFNHQDFNFKNTEKLPSLSEIIGQPRVDKALDFALGIQDHGYHIYAAGPVGAGKATIIRKYLEKEAKTKQTPPDLLYVNNFEDSNKPKRLTLPAGKGREFRDDMEQLVLELKNEVPKAFEAEIYEKERENIEKEFQAESGQLFEKLAKKSDEKGFRLLQTPQGFAVLPIVGGQPLTPEEQTKLNDKDLKKIQQAQQDLINEIHETMRKFEQLQKDGKKKLYELDQRVVWLAINHIIDSIQDKYSSYDAVKTFLASVHQHLLKNVQAFKQIKQVGNASMQERLLMIGNNEPTFDEYRVNLVVDNSKTCGAPVIFEKNPTAPNLIGRIEQQSWMGTLVTNFRMIKEGALHRANGGYLIVDILDILKKPFAWEILKRTIKNEEIVIESMNEAFGAFSTRTLDPEPIPLNTKIILIGDPGLYYLVYEHDPEFKELFRVKVDFDTDMEWNEKSAYQYAQFISMICREENLKHFTAEAVAKIVEHGARLTEHQNKISLKFGDIVDVIRQSCFWAEKNNDKYVTKENVQKALDEKIYRSNRIEELLRDMITEKTIKISTQGEAIGQINGLSVLSLGDYRFGKPSRITARTFVGNAGLVSIEREIEMGGPIHNKGAMIITGYLGGKYAQDFPLAMSASITFEQVYEPIEGDSASAAEIYALLSSLSGYPIRQDLAITGSVNQHGEIQAIGGVNEKIEGVFKVCKVFGLTGSQGVIIPESNVKHLMLHEEVVEAVESGKFHIYAIATIDEGIPILMGKPSGIKKSNGEYHKDTVNWAVQQKIMNLAEKAREFGKNKKKKK